MLTLCSVFSGGTVEKSGPKPFITDGRANGRVEALGAVVYAINIYI